MYPGNRFQLLCATLGVHTVFRVHVASAGREIENGNSSLPTSASSVCSKATQTCDSIVESSFSIHSNCKRAIQDSCRSVNNAAKTGSTALGAHSLATQNCTAYVISWSCLLPRTAWSWRHHGRTLGRWLGSKFKPRPRSWERRDLAYVQKICRCISMQVLLALSLWTRTSTRWWRR